MIAVSEIQTVPPGMYRNELQERTYKALQELEIPFQRVDTDEVITMEDCVAINKKLDMEMVKTLFLCERTQTVFYMLITTGSKPFKSKDFSARLDVSRLSFAPVERMEAMLQTKIGAATVFSMLLDSAKRVKLIIDKEVAEQEYYGCSDGTTTGYMKIKTSDILQTFFPFAACRPTIIKI